MSPLLDLIVLIPGILGSRLVREEQGRRAIWDSSFSVLADVLINRRRAGCLEALRDVQSPLIADSLIQGITLVPGLKKIKGYREISSRIRRTFAGAEPQHEGDPPGFIEFPYDWRQDNRRTAELLKERVTHSLSEWQKFKKDPGAKAILVGHSMGGLIASYYIECLEGWKNCRALIPIGTPFRGSWRAVDYLVNGYRLAGIDATRVLSSFPSTFQLLPTYAGVVHASGHAVFGQAPPGLPIGLQQGGVTERIREGLLFNHEIAEAMGSRPKGQARPDVVCYVGTGQPTFQSVNAVSQHWKPQEVLPVGVSAIYEDGDGVVPHYSAMHPAAIGHPGLLHSFADFHADLCANDRLLEDVCGVLRQYQDLAVRERPVLAQGVVPTAPIRVEGIDDCYWVGADLDVRAKVSGAGTGVQPGISMVAEVWRLREDGKEYTDGDEYELKWDGQWHTAPIRIQHEGVYEVKVRPADRTVQLPFPATDVFAAFNQVDP